ncbi:biotin--acetyl-CoA-carboxylase ligase (Precursor) [Novosphingobium sp. PY1]|nr:biotin--acetyl-CoA-carboxylase ligase (Precursor) [Novosphingobium sp. PY1]
MKDGNVTLTRRPLQNRRGTAADQSRQELIEQLQGRAIECRGWPEFKIIAAEPQRLCEASRGSDIQRIESPGLFSFGLSGCSYDRPSFTQLSRKGGPPLRFVSLSGLHLCEIVVSPTQTAMPPIN